MADDLRYLSKIVRERARQVLAALPDEVGHGSSLTIAVKDVVAGIDTSSEVVATGGPYTDVVERVHVRTLQRHVDQLNVLYEFVAHFRNDVGRTDVPIGLLHLTDELIEDLLPSGADPLLHLNTEHMYSTFSIFHAIPSILDPAGHPEPHPVAFNVPGLDPANALFAPILAHEVGHTCWQRGMGRDLQTMLDVAAIEAELQAAVRPGQDPAELRKAFEGWMQELMCDALAATLTGPAFLFASAVFLPVVAQPKVGTHPYPRDRIAFTLRILDRFGWTPVLRGQVPAVLDWCQELANTPTLSGSPIETALRKATLIAEPAMMNLAERAAANRVTSEEFVAICDDVFAHLNLEIPPVSIDGRHLHAWLLITAAWIREIRERGDRPTELPAIATDRRLNRFVLKAVELAGIARLWSNSGAPAA